MKETQAAGVLFLMFALRCIAPLLITLGIGYLMNRLVDRWEAEETAAGLQDATEAVASPPLIPVQEPVAKRPAITVPCWIMRNCDEAAMADCAARKYPGIPCWLARLRAEGSLPQGCSDCPIYEDAMPSPAV